MTPERYEPDVSTATLPFLHLDTLWLQVTGTLCNIACRHCFISCGPKVEIHGMMSVDEVREAIEEAAALGCCDYWFTGGEPFLHPDILTLVDIALEHGPLGILTNGMLIDEKLATELARRFRDSHYSLDVRVSLDGLDAAENDDVRGRGVFAATTQGIEHLVEAGIEPVIAITTVNANNEGEDARLRFMELLRQLGVRRPRIKLIPPFKIGREVYRSGERYNENNRVTDAMLDSDTPWTLQCGTSRMVTDRGVWPCPILINEDEARMGDTLRDGLRPQELSHPACHTCYVEGFSCRT